MLKRSLWWRISKLGSFDDRRARRCHLENVAIVINTTIFMFSHQILFQQNLILWIYMLDFSSESNFVIYDKYFNWVSYMWGSLVCDCKWNLIIYNFCYNCLLNFIWSAKVIIQYFQVPTSDESKSQKGGPKKLKFSNLLLKESIIHQATLSNNGPSTTSDMISRAAVV